MAYYRRLGRPGAIPGHGRWRVRDRRHVPYWSVLLRFLLDENRWLLAGVKLFSCGLLYLLLRVQTLVDYDLRAVYFSYSMALFGHGILMFRCRGLETGRMMWYRGWMTPNPIRFIVVLELGVAGYSLLFLVGCCLTVIPLRVSEFIKLWLVLFGVWYGCVLGGFLIAMSGLFAGAAVILFCVGYYRFEVR